MTTHTTHYYTPYYTPPARVGVGLEVYCVVSVVCIYIYFFILYIRGFGYPYLCTTHYTLHKNDSKPRGSKAGGTTHLTTQLIHTTHFL